MPHRGPVSVLLSFSALSASLEAIILHFSLKYPQRWLLLLLLLRLVNVA
jgi:hypothetical protein